MEKIKNLDDFVKKNVGKRVRIKVGSGITTMTYASEEFIRENIFNLILHTFFDGNFYYNYTNQKKEYYDKLKVYVKNVESNFAKFYNNYMEIEERNYDKQYVVKKILDYEEFFFIENKDLLSESLKNDYIDYSKSYKGKTVKLKQGGSVNQNHKQLGTATKLGITPKIKAHDMISECANCRDKFSYQNFKSNILWECPNCLSKKHIF